MQVSETKHELMHCIGIFAALMMLIISFDLEDQKRVQSVFSSLSATCISIMLITLVVAIAIEPYDRGDERGETHISGDVPIW